MIHTIAVLRGGPSSEYEVSLKTGKSVITALQDVYRIIDITIDKQGVWHKEGIEVEPLKVLRGVDVVFNAMHGEYGEDGQVQELLQCLNVPFTGPKKLAAVVSINKVKTKELYESYDIKTPDYRVVEKGEDIHQVAIEMVREFRMPVIVKPADKGSSVGITIATNYKELENAFSVLFENCNVILVEEVIKGKEGTVGVVEGLRDEKLYTLPVVEIIPPSDKNFFDYNAKYGGKTKEICPGNFTQKEKETMKEYARLAHHILGLRHYSRTDFMIHPTRGIFTLETNALPGLTSESLLPKGLEAVGVSYKDFLKHVLETAFKDSKHK